MKKIITFIVTFLLIFAVSGCDFSMQNSDNEPTPTAPVSTENGKITEEQAIEIASQYWGVKSGEKDTETGFPFLIMPVDSSNDNIKIALKWLVDDSHYSTIDMIEIDSITGEILKGDVG